MSVQDVATISVPKMSDFDFWLMGQLAELHERIAKLEAKYTEEDDE